MLRPIGLALRGRRLPLKTDLSKLVKKQSLESKPGAAFSVCLMLEVSFRLAFASPSPGEGQLRPSNKWNATLDRAQLGRADSGPPRPRRSNNLTLPQAIG